MNPPSSCERITFGTLRRQTEAGDFLLTESVYAPGLRTAVHAHAATSLVFGLRGELEQVHGSDCGELRPGSLLILPREVFHADRVGKDGCSCLFVTLSSDLLTSLSRQSQVLESIRFTRGGRVPMVCAAIQREARIHDSVRPLAIAGLVYQVLADVSREPSPGWEGAAPWLRAVRERLESEYVHSPSMKELANQAGVSPSYLLRAFARQYGLSIGTFLRRRRIEWAMTALKTSREPIEEIAHAAGFFDQSHFTRCFKHIVGTTPARFRNEPGAQGWSTGT